MVEWGIKSIFGKVSGSYYGVPKSLKNLKSQGAEGEHTSEREENAKKAK